MQKHRYMQRARKMKDIQQCIANKDFATANKHLSNMLQEETNDRYVKHLRNIHNTLGEISKNASRNFTGVPDGEDTELLANYCGETAEHFDGMAEIEAEKLSFTGSAPDEMDNFIGEAATAHEYDLFAGIEQDTNDLLVSVIEDNTPSLNFGGKAKERKAAKADKKARKAAAKEQRQAQRKAESDARIKLKNAKAEAKLLDAQSGASAERKANKVGLLKDLAGKYMDVAGRVAGNVAGGLANTYLGTDIQPMGNETAPTGEEKGTDVATQTGAPQPAPEEKKPLLPIWAWIAIAVAVLALIGGGTWYFMRKKK